MQAGWPLRQSTGFQRQAAPHLLLLRVGGQEGVLERGLQTGFPVSSIRFLPAAVTRALGSSCCQGSPGRVATGKLLKPSEPWRPPQENGNVIVCSCGRARIRNRMSTTPPVSETGTNVQKSKQPDRNVPYLCLAPTRCGETLFPSCLLPPASLPLSLPSNQTDFTILLTKSSLPFGESQIPFQPNTGGSPRRSRAARRAHLGRALVTPSLWGSQQCQNFQELAREANSRALPGLLN